MGVLIQRMSVMLVYDLLSFLSKINFQIAQIHYPVSQEMCPDFVQCHSN